MQTACCLETSVALTPLPQKSCIALQPHTQPNLSATIQNITIHKVMHIHKLCTFIIYALEDCINKVQHACTLFVYCSVMRVGCRLFIPMQKGSDKLHLHTLKTGKGLKTKLCLTFSRILSVDQYPYMQFATRIFSSKYIQMPMFGLQCYKCALKKTTV